MDEYEIRTLTAEDANAHRNLMAHAFSQGRVVARSEANAEEDAQYGVNTRGLFVGGRLQASLTALPFAVHWGGESTLKMGGVAGVATFADARGRGYVDALLRDSLRTMRERGEYISSLYPFAWAFYQRFGWDWVGEKRSVTLPLRELKSAPEGRKVQVVEGDAVQAALESAYTAFAKRYRGMFTAETHQWKQALAHSDNRTTYPYGFSPVDGAPPESYLLWRYDGTGGGGQVREFVTNSVEGFRALLSLLHYFGTQAQKARITVPADAPVWSYLVHWDLETRVSPVFMGRVVDVAQAFAQLSAVGGEEGTCTLALRDEHAPWNDGLFRLTREGGKTECTPLVGGAAEPDVTLDIRALSQAFWGHPSLDRLRMAGRVAVHNEAGYQVLAAALPPAGVFTMDDF
jgi:Predicted acetyltransferase involved in intracellular survival and related acetyltransferases